MPEHFPSPIEEEPEDRLTSEEWAILVLVALVFVTGLATLGWAVIHAVSDVEVWVISEWSSTVRIRHGEVAVKRRLTKPAGE